MKLATYRSNGKERIAVVHGGDNSLFDLSASARRSGAASAIFDSMLSLIDGGDAALDQAHELFEKHGGDPDLRCRSRRQKSWRRCLNPARCATGCRFPCTSFKPPAGNSS